MTIKKIYHCYECGKTILNPLSPKVVSFDDLNFAHWDCLYKNKK